MRKNKNRGYQQLRVWQDAQKLYELTCSVYLKWDYSMQRVVRNQIASADSVHRNIAEGYCRKSLNEYLRFLDYALASLGETVSANLVYRKAGQLMERDFEEMDVLCNRLENSLMRLIASLERKRRQGDWDDSFDG